MTPRPALSVVVPGIGNTQAQGSGGRAEMSFEKFFGPVRPVDLHRWQRCFPDRAASYFRATGMSAAEIAVAYGVNARTAQNWLDGICRPNGAVMALVALQDRAGFETHFSPERRAA